MSDLQEPFETTLQIIKELKRMVHFAKNSTFFAELRKSVEKMMHQ